MPGLLISRDLFFTSKVTSTAAALGLTVQAVPDVASALLRCEADDVAAVFVDLAQDPGDLRSLCQAPKRPQAVIAFGSHVDVARLNAARDAGCDEVLPRSKFSATLPELLKANLGEPEA